MLKDRNLKYVFRSPAHGGMSASTAYIFFSDVLPRAIKESGGLTSWLSIPVSLACAAVLAVIVGYLCFKFKITGHYFALVTLALTEVVRQTIIATRDHTGGSLGFTPTPKGNEDVPSIIALQFDEKETYFLIAIGVWLVGLLIWRALDRSMMGGGKRWQVPAE